jgi:predicted GIY-YIG superfamily endonuclease
MKDAFYYVYFLVSELDEDFHYTGITTDLETRFARAFERYLKSGSGREFSRRQ